MLIQSIQKPMNIFLIILLASSCANSDFLKMRKSNIAESEEKSLLNGEASSELKDRASLAEVVVFGGSSKVKIQELKSAKAQKPVEKKVNHEVISSDTGEDDSHLSAYFENSLDLKYEPKLFNWWINFFTKREKARFNRHLNNGIRYKKLIKSIFTEHGLPEDLYYVGLIESGFNMTVRSRAGATGPWQFMKGTAKGYGLKVNKYVDERANLIKATHAAARYFKDLYNIFSSWELALCAYNAGEYRIIRAIRKGNTRDYQKLVKLKLLPKETIYYIPKVAAAKIIIDSPEKFGFKVNYNQVNYYKDHQSLAIPYPFSLKVMARKLGVPRSELKRLNPDIRRDHMYRLSSSNPHELILPKRIDKNLISDNKAGKIKFRKVLANELSGISTYLVKKGDNLFKIAKKHALSITKIKKINSLRSSKIYVGQKLKLEGGASISQGKRLRKVSSKKSIKKQRKVIHRVQKGENLTQIAQTYGVGVKSLRRSNRIRGSKIMVGQKLKVPSKDFQFYTVRRGDNLSKIADRFGLNIYSLKSANQLKSSKIFPGRKLLIPSKG